MFPSQHLSKSSNSKDKTTTMKPKFSSGYLTPQPNRKKSLPKEKRCESSENLLNTGEINDEVFQKLMNCPVKRKLILNLISSEKQNIDAYKKKLEQNDSSPLRKVLKKPCESPTALLRRRALEQQRNDSGSRPASRQSIAPTSPVILGKILEGVVAFVEVRTGNADRSAGVRATLMAMGATISDNFTRDVTHVIFKDGSFTTFQKANLLRSKLVSVMWIEACKTAGVRVPEKDFPAVGTDAYDHNVSALCSQMQRDYEDIIREEFNRSLASGKALPLTKSLISRRRTMNTPNLSGINTLSSFSSDSEVANIMRRTISEADFNESDNSDTDAIIDGDSTKSLEGQDMDLTYLQGKRTLICSKENYSPNRRKTEIDARNFTSKGNQTGSPGILEASIFRRRTELFESTTPSEKTSNISVLTPKNIKIYSKNTSIVTPDATVKKIGQKEEAEKPSTSTIDTIMSVLQISEKTTSTNMSSLRLNNSNKEDSFKSNKNSFSPLQPDVVKGILEILDKQSPPKRSSSSKSDSSQTTPTKKVKLSNENVTVRKKSAKNDHESPSDNGVAKNCRDTKKRRQTIAVIGDKVLRSAKTNISLIGNTNTRENDSEVDETPKNADEKLNKNKRPRRKNLVKKETTENILTLERKFDEYETTENIATPNKILDKRETTEDFSELEKNLDQKESTEKIPTPNKNLDRKKATKKIPTPNKSLDEKETTEKITTLKSPNIVTTRRLRKLYDPCNPLTETMCADDEERRYKRQNAKRDSDTGIFVKPSNIFSKVIDSDTSSGESPLKVAPKISMYTENTNNTENDEQIELAKEFLNKVRDEEENDESPDKSLFKPSRKTTKKNKNDESPQKSSQKNETPKKSTRTKTNKNIETPPSSRATRKSMRVSKPQTPRWRSSPPKNLSTNVKLTQITPLKNRRSTLEFRSTTESSARRKLKIDAMKSPSIVCTKMHKSDVQVFTQIVKKLGGFNVEDEVSNRTTHLVAGEPKRTINMLRAVTRGCWVLKKEWLYKSLESEKWLPEEDYEETDFSPAVQQNRLQRQAFGSSYTMDIFRDCGTMYVSRGSTPRCSDLQELILLCKGKITKIARSAAIVIGEYMKYEGVTCVTETWLLDSISTNKKLPFKKYLISANRRSIFV